MRQVMIRCPNTGELAPTGVEATSPEKLDQPSYLLIDCLEGGQDRAWEPSQACLAGPILVAASQWAW